MTDKYRINLDFVAPEPAPASFFCMASEEEFTDEFRNDLFDNWRKDGVKQVRVTLVNKNYPESGYPFGVWIEGWTDEAARQLPFGKGYPDESGPAYPPLVAQPAQGGEAGTATTPKSGVVHEHPVAESDAPNPPDSHE